MKTMEELLGLAKRYWGPGDERLAATLRDAQFDALRSARAMVSIQIQAGRGEMSSWQRAHDEGVRDCVEAIDRLLSQIQ